MHIAVAAEMDPPGPYLPAAHAEPEHVADEVAPAALEYVPAGQQVHSVAPALEYVPAGQEAHVDAPASDDLPTDSGESAPKSQRHRLR